MNDRDYALVVGISRYPALSKDGFVKDLQGPDNDALAFKQWLIDPKGGAVPEANIRFVRTADLEHADDPDDPKPAQEAVHALFDWLLHMGEGQDKPIPVGRRLYVYMSGHGFAPRAIGAGALFTADATALKASHVYTTEFVNWFAGAGYFEEIVLLMDCCLNREISIVPEAVPYRFLDAQGPAPKVFIGLAAVKQSALEYTMPDGKVHGVFTWTLLQGLRNAVDGGRVTSDSLRKFLYSMKDFIPEEFRLSRDVGVRPWVGGDPDIVFSPGAEAGKVRTTLGFPPQAEGSQVRIWAGTPYAWVAEGQISAGTFTIDLDRGLYVAEVAAAGLRHGFQVTGAEAAGATAKQRVEVTRTGAPVQFPPARPTFSIAVTASNPAAVVTLLDSRLERRATTVGDLAVNQPPGVYVATAQFGRDLANGEDVVVLLDRDVVLQLAPVLASPAPIPGSALTHEYQVAAFEQPTPRAAGATRTAAITVLARYWTPERRRGPHLRFPHPFEGLQLLDGAGHPVVDLGQAGSIVSGPDGLDPCAQATVYVDPGAYSLRQTFGNKSLEMAAIASAGWDTQVVLRRSDADASANGREPRVRALGEVTVFMRRFGAMPDPRHDALLEAARSALAEKRRIFSRGPHAGIRLKDLLVYKFDDPIAGILGGHLLLLAVEQGELPHIGDLDSVVVNLRRLVGSDHPDVEALSLQCLEPALRAKRPFAAPPMFRESWRVVIQASYQRPDLVPAALWERVHAATAIDPCFIWASDDESRWAHAEGLRRWVGERASRSRARTARVAELPRPVAGPGEMIARRASASEITPEELLVPASGLDRLGHEPAAAAPGADAGEG